jgi:hypothetical protein
MKPAQLLLCWRCLQPCPGLLLPGVRCIKCLHCGALLL